MTDILNWHNIEGLNAANKEWRERQEHARKAAAEARQARKEQLQALKARGPLTGAMLLEQLSTLTAEQLALPILLEGCDCDGLAYTMDTDGEGTDSIYLKRLEAY